MLELREPYLEDKESVLDFRNSFVGENTMFPMEGLANYRVIINYENWLKKKVREEIEVYSGEKYTEKTYILVDENNYIYGACNIRYPLVGNLFNLGGNIGYAIRPNERGKGYGVELLKLAMLKCKELGLDKILITARVNNVQSNKLIEKCGGVLDTDYLDEMSGIMFHRYWINLK